MAIVKTVDDVVVEAVAKEWTHDLAHIRLRVAAMFGAEIAERLEECDPPLACAAMTVDGWVFRLDAQSQGGIAALVGGADHEAATWRALDGPADLDGELPAQLDEPGPPEEGGQP